MSTQIFSLRRRLRREYCYGAPLKSKLAVLEATRNGRHVATNPGGGSDSIAARYWLRDGYTVHLRRLCERKAFVFCSVYYLLFVLFFVSALSLPCNFSHIYIMPVSDYALKIEDYELELGIPPITENHRVYVNIRVDDAIDQVSSS